MTVFDNGQTPTVDPVESLVGEGKKFKTVEDLAKGKLEADAFIERLTNELAEVRTELGKTSTAETQLTELREQIQRLQAERNQAKPTNQGQLSEADIANLVTKTLTGIEATRTSNQNLQSANSEMVKQYGSVDKASEALRNRAGELGLTVDALKNIAEKSPTAFLKLVNGEQTPVPVVVTTGGTQQAPAVNAGKAKEGSEAYYNEMMRINRKEYLSEATQKRIWASIKAGTYYS